MTKNAVMFDCDSQQVSNSLKGAASGRERLAGTSDSPQSASLMDDQVVDDYRNEIFSSGDEHYDVQWANINKKYRQNIRQRDKGFILVKMKMLQRKFSMILLRVTRLEARQR